MRNLLQIAPEVADEESERRPDEETENGVAGLKSDYGADKDAGEGGKPPMSRC